MKSPGVDAERRSIPGKVRTANRLADLRSKLRTAGADGGDHGATLDGVINRTRRSVQNLVRRVADTRSREAGDESSRLLGSTERELKDDLIGAGGRATHADRMMLKAIDGQMPQRGVRTVTISPKADRALAPARRDRRGRPKDQPGMTGGPDAPWIEPGTEPAGDRPIGATPGVPVRIAVSGPARYGDAAWMPAALDRAAERANGPLSIIVGDGGGGDRKAREWAQENGVEYSVFAADWDGEGRSAGTVRNALMMSEGRPTMLLACPADEDSRQARSAVKAARDHGVPVEIATRRGDTYPYPGPASDALDAAESDAEVWARLDARALEAERELEEKARLAAEGPAAGDDPDEWPDEAPWDEEEPPENPPAGGGAGPDPAAAAAGDPFGMGEAAAPPENPMSTA